MAPPIPKAYMPRRLVALLTTALIASTPFMPAVAQDNWPSKPIQVIVPVGNRVNFAVPSPIVALPHIKSGKLIPLAIAQPNRSPLLPDVPTTVELGYPRLTIQAWSGILMPAGVPPAIVKRANAALHKATADPDVAAQLQKQAITIAATRACGGA